MQSVVLRNTHLRQQRTLPNVDARGSLSWAVRNGLLEATEGKDNQSHDKGEEDVAPAVEETTSLGPADRKS